MALNIKVITTILKDNQLILIWEEEKYYIRIIFDIHQWYSTEIECVATESGYGVVPVATIGKFKIKAKA